MIVDDSGGFLTQRTQPRMALVDTALDGDRLLLGAPGLPPLVLPRRPHTGTRREVTVWRDRCDALSLGLEAAEWLTRFLGVGCELVYMPDETLRAVNPDHAPGRIVSFADGYPFLLASVASLDAINARGAAASMERFRPNLVVDGSPPFAEDGWAALEVGVVRFRVLKPCARCSIVTVDPRSGTVGKEPLQTLAAFRRSGNDVLFGQNLIAETRGRVRVGDACRAEPVTRPHSS
jgi:uncharacterized protein YcbX